MNIKLTGVQDRDKEIIHRLPANLKKYIKEFAINPESIKKRDEYSSDKIKFYKEKGYSDSEIKVFEEYLLSFGQIGIEIQKKIIVFTFHTHQSLVYQECNLFYMDVNYLKEMNSVGFEIKKIADKVTEYEVKDEEDY